MKKKGSKRQLLISVLDIKYPENHTTNRIIEVRDKVFDNNN